MRRWLLPALLLAAASQAQAHAFSPDADHFYSGLTHAFVDPAQWLLLLTLGLLAARQGVRTDRLIVLGAPAVALLISALVTLMAPDPGWLLRAEVAVLSVAAVTGLLVALDRPLLTTFTAMLAGLAGATLGAVNAVELARASWLVPHLYLSGAALGILFLVLLIYGPSRRLMETAPWSIMAARVLGSWSAAGACLLLALTLLL